MKPDLKIFYLLSFLCLLLFTSLKCNRGEEKFDEQKLKEHLMNANRIMVKDEMAEIAEFITRHQLKLDSSGTGLRYTIATVGSRNTPAINDSVLLTGKIFLLDATLCYDYTMEKPLGFLIGHKEVSRGIEEAALLMPEGSKGNFIIPSHLGYGMLGDRNKIPGNSALYAELELLRIVSTGKK